MFNVAVMSTNNPVLILGAFALNGLYRVLSALVALIAWLVPAVLGFVASHWRVVAVFAGLVVAVVLVALFWMLEENCVPAGTNCGIWLSTDSMVPVDEF